MAITVERGPQASVQNLHPSCSSDAGPQQVSKSRIAELTSDEIRQLAPAELVRVVMSARPCTVSDDVAERLTFYDRATLERLAFLTRRLCRRGGY